MEKPERNLKGPRMDFKTKEKIGKRLKSYQKHRNIGHRNRKMNFDESKKKKRFDVCKTATDQNGPKSLN